MPVTLTAIGIQSIDLTLAESLERTRKVETKVIRDKDGAFADGEAYDPTEDFSIKGRGDLPEAIALGVDAEGVGLYESGVTIVTSVTETETNEDFNSWECSGQHFPGAS